jgi:hypothetical protein
MTHSRSGVGGGLIINFIFISFGSFIIIPDHVQGCGYKTDRTVKLWITEKATTLFLIYWGTRAVVRHGIYPGKCNNFLS